MSFSYLGIFPFCVQDGNDYGVDPIETGPGTIYPFGMSLADAMALYWKVRTFRFYGSYGFNFDYISDVTPRSLTISDTFNSTVESQFYWPNTMKEMICNDTTPFFYGTTSGSGTVSSSSGITTSTITFVELDCFHFPFANEQGAVVFKNNLYYPKFTLNISSDNEYSAFYSSVKPEGSTSYFAVENMLSLIVNGSTYSTTFYAGVPDGFVFGASNLAFNGALIVEQKDARLAE